MLGKTAVGPDGSRHIADGDHTVKTLTSDGELVLTLGKKN